MAGANGLRYPLEIESVDCNATDPEKLVVRVTGRWTARGRPPQGGVSLVLEEDGPGHRFPALPEPRRSRLARPGARWTATFALPVRHEPRLHGQALLSIDDFTIPLPALSADEQSEQSELVAAEGESSEGGGTSAEAAGEPDPQEGPSAPPDQADAAASPRQRPAIRPTTPAVAAEFAAKIQALRGELKERATAEGRVRGMLADTQAELKARLAAQTRLEATHADLRHELEQLLERIAHDDSGRAEAESKALTLTAQVVELQEHVAELTSSRDRLAAELKTSADREVAQRSRWDGRERELRADIASLHAQLAEVSVGGEAARSEAEGLRTELQRLGSELAETRENTATRTGELGEARALLEEVRALNARLAARHGEPVDATIDAG